jgi:Leucine-rich repeat (LRR) protein
MNDKINDLDFSRFNEEDLYLSKKGITNLSSLEISKTVKTLDLSQNKITDIFDLLNNFNKYSKLEFISLVGNKIPLLQINHFKEIYPNTKISYSVCCENYNLVNFNISCYSDAICG